MAKVTSEGELLTLFAEHLDSAERCIRHLAHHREDMKYLAIAELVHNIRQKAMFLARMKARPRSERLLLPEVFH